MTHGFARLCGSHVRRPAQQTDTPSAVAPCVDLESGSFRDHFATCWTSTGMVPIATVESFVSAQAQNDDTDAPASVRRLVVDERTPDDVLAAAACAGDPRAPTVIWRRYVAQVRSKLRQWIGPHDVDDHVQDVFSRLLEQLPRMRQANALRGYLMGITLRVACTELRRRRRSRLLLTTTGELPEPREVGGDRGPAREAVWRLAGILERLGPHARELFLLRYVQKLELVDVATAMDISLATAKRHLTRTSAQVTAMVVREPALADFVKDSAASGSIFASPLEAIA
jgi:RNA polymerase sigma-70 factor (ECF subfamily)